MTLSIGILTADHSCEYIKRSLLDRAGSKYRFTFCPYSSIDELLKLFQAQKDQFDGIIFSGLFPYRIVCTRYGIPETPTTYLDLDHRDYYRELLSVTYRNPHLDIRRIWLDAPSIDIPWEYIFGDPTAVPYIGQCWSDLTSDHFYDIIMEEYLQAYRNHQVDFIITRMTNLTARLKEAGIPHTLIFPSPSSIWTTVEKLVQLIHSRQGSSALSAVGFFQPAEGMSMDRLTKLHTWLQQFNKEYGGSLIILQTSEEFEVLTSNSALLQITRSYTGCALSEYIRSNCDVPFSTGWGVGVDILQAQRSAFSALKESRNNPSHAPYLIDQDNRLIGPLGSPECLASETEPTRSAYVLAKEIGVSLSTAQRLLSVWRSKSDCRLTRNDLSLYLNTSARTANRILKKLAETGAAKIVGTEKTGAAGRPISVFQLDLRTLFDPVF